MMAASSSVRTSRSRMTSLPSTTMSRTSAALVHSTSVSTTLPVGHIDGFTRSTVTRSATTPGSTAPAPSVAMKSAPFSVAMLTMARAGMTAGSAMGTPWVTFMTERNRRISAQRESPSWAAPSVPRPSTTPRERRLGVSGVAYAQLDTGQWQTLTPRSTRMFFSTSESMRQWAPRKRSERTPPRRSRYSKGRTPWFCRV